MESKKINWQELRERIPDRDQVNIFYRLKNTLSNISNSFENKDYKTIISNIKSKQLENLEIKDKIRIKKLLENMWINESFLYNEKVSNLYFYLRYISFYYSIFNSISIILRLHPDNLKENHERKVNNFNQKLIIKEGKSSIFKLYEKPFNIVVSNKINNLGVNIPIDNYNYIDRLIKNKINEYKEQFYKEQFTIQGKLQINKDVSIYDLKILRSIMKLKEEEYNSNSKISILSYFMKRRQNLHYNLSYIDFKSYNFNENILEMLENMRKIVRYYNKITESILFKLDCDLIESTYDNFKSNLKDTILKEEIDKLFS